MGLMVREGRLLIESVSLLQSRSGATEKLRDDLAGLLAALGGDAL